MIFDSCQFTVRGLTLLCERHSGWRVCGTADSFSLLLQLLSRQHVDLILCGIGRQVNDFSRLLKLPDSLSGRCILLTDKCSDVLRSFFLTAGFNAVVSKQTSLNTLASSLYYSAPFIRRNTQTDIALTRYHPIEKEVLSALLNGKKPHNIARDMGISYRMVSRFKQNGLKRAGLNSLNEILACQNGYSLK